jgi:hypothetical protein
MYVFLLVYDIWLQFLLLVFIDSRQFIIYICIYFTLLKLDGFVFEERSFFVFIQIRIWSS